MEIKLTVHEDLPFDEETSWTEFDIGTCNGYFGDTKYICELFMIGNKEKGNGHFDATLKWFENKCKLENKNFLISHIENDRLLQHLIKKRDYTLVGNCHAEKKFLNINKQNT